MKRFLFLVGLACAISFSVVFLIFVWSRISVARAKSAAKRQFRSCMDEISPYCLEIPREEMSYCEYHHVAETQFLAEMTSENFEFFYVAMEEKGYLLIGAMEEDYLLHPDRYIPTWLRNDFEARKESYDSYDCIVFQKEESAEVQILMIVCKGEPVDIYCEACLHRVR